MDICNINYKYLSYLKGITLVGSSFVTAISIYIQIVDHPGLLVLPTEYSLSRFRYTFKKVLALQVGLTVSTTITSLLTFLSIYNSKCSALNNKSMYIQNSLNHYCKCRGYLWLLGSLLVFSTLPYTYIWIQPINRKLLSNEIESSYSQAKSLMVNWGRLHKPRTIVLVAATSCFFYKIFNNNSLNK